MESAEPLCDSFAGQQFTSLSHGNDPRREFIASLCTALGGSGSIVVYYQPFEEQRLLELATWLPEFAGRIKKIQRRLWDLLPIVRNHVYHPAFAGSYSLKAVLPALVPDMTYEGTVVASGQDAGLGRAMCSGAGGCGMAH